MRIGFIGLGIMGEAMCYNIIRKHDGDVYIYDVKTEPVQRLAEKGGIACDSAVDAAKHSDVIITMLPRSEDSLSVYKEILPAVNATKAAAVLGNIGIYVGGEKEIYFQVKPILQYMGSNVLYMGSSGKGIGMKICQTTLLAQIQNGVNEALAMAVKQGIDVDRFTAALSFGGGQNAYFDERQMAIRNKDYATTFSVRNMSKDIDICRRLAKTEGVQAESLEGIREVYDRALEAGYGDKDYSSVIDMVFEKNYVKYKPKL